jgi:hypothetical protein
MGVDKCRRLEGKASQPTAYINSWISSPASGPTTVAEDQATTPVTIATGPAPTP